MESNEISMFMDAKLDIHNKNPEATQLLTWTKCLVKIEAIKCFPCYLRITFIRNVENESANLCVRINIPGITIRLASSRTRSYSYGIFWKHNRKRCCIFFAFDTQMSCERHMKWFKKSLKNLELHRQEIFETRLRSREDPTIIDLTKTLEMHNFFNFNDSNDKKNLQDILGPLPKIPDIRESGNWSRRISDTSQIYEEIPEFRRESRRISRASGIYEEMRPPLVSSESIRNKNYELPPPLPPRKRVNTYQLEDSVESIPRCNTNPEFNLIRKKQYLRVLENVFIARSESVSEGQVSTAEELIDLVNTPDKAASTVQLYSNNSVTPRVKRKFPFIKNNKRNSFSSPDLSKMNHFDEFESVDYMSSLSSDLQISHGIDYCTNADGCSSSSVAINSPVPDDDDNTADCSDVIQVDLHISPVDPAAEEEENGLNISDQITSNFNFSCNSSTINLVGSNLNAASPGSFVIEDLSGYCAMAPIIRKTQDPDNKSSDTPSNSSGGTPSNDSDKENEDELKKLLLLPAKNPINVIQDNKINQSDIIYQNIEIPQKPDLIPDPENKHIDVKIVFEEDYYKTPRKSVISVDDKIPSYYPNSCDTKKTQRQRQNQHQNQTNQNNSSVRHLANVKLIHNENVYISSPQKILDQRKTGISNILKGESSLKAAALKACKISENVYSVTRMAENDQIEFEKKQQQVNNSVVAISFGAIQNIEFTFDDSNTKIISGNSNITTASPRLNIVKNPRTELSTRPRIYQKFLTVARTVPNKYADKSGGGSGTNKAPTTPTKSSELSPMKKFTSLPRFKRIDFSPLKTKINNVLQRNQSDGL